MLISVSFTPIVILSAVLAVKSLTIRPLGKVISSWRFVGAALAGWVFGEALFFGFHVFLNLFPVGAPRGNLLAYLVLPSLAIFIPTVGAVANRVYSAVNIFKVPEGWGELKGLPKEIVLYKHVMGHVSVVNLNFINASFVDLLITEAMVEAIFGWPGVGTLLLNTAPKGDFAVVEGTLLAFSSVLIAANYVTDLVYGLLDPRVRR